jgi:hypothetical protein
MTLKLPPTEVNWPHFHLNEYISYFASLVVKSRGLLRRTDEGALLACMGNDMWNSILFESLDLSKELNLIDVVARWGQFFASNGVDHYDAYFLSTIPNKYAKYVHLIYWIRFIFPLNGTRKANFVP